MSSTISAQDLNTHRLGAKKKNINASSSRKIAGGMTRRTSLLVSLLPLAFGCRSLRRTRPYRLGGCELVRRKAARNPKTRGMVDAVLRPAGARDLLSLAAGVGNPIHATSSPPRRRASCIYLTIITALSLRKPTARTDLEKRLVADR